MGGVPSCASPNDDSTVGSIRTSPSILVRRKRVRDKEARAERSLVAVEMKRGSGDERRENIANPLRALQGDLRRWRMRNVVLDARRPDARVCCRTSGPQQLRLNDASESAQYEQPRQTVDDLRIDAGQR
jgi:hypothetical protein